ncbi:MAG TPA: ABC transporter substrate-binding protein, partial [Gaiellaceae bacterium]|nr:ABC transporter substrate-binding protein [Gaiellaceae bacterium]
KQVVVAPIQVGNGPDGIVFGAGKIWVTNGLDGTVSEIDPQTNTVVDVIPDVGNGPSGIAVSGRYLWVANSNDGTLARVDPVSGAVRTVTSVGSGADGVAVGRGSIWVTNQSAGTVTRIDARSGSVLRTINAGSGAGALAVGAGLVWVANSLDGTVTEIDPSSDAVRSTIPVGDGPNGVALAPGAIWVSNELGGTLSRIDPARGAVVRTVATGNRPEGVVVDGGSLFVAVRASGAAHRGETLSVLTTSGGVPNIDPALGYGPEELQLLSVTNDGLTGFRRVSGIAGTTLVPDLAVSLPTPTGGGLFYSFQLRPGIRYSTGVLVRPQDFRRAIERSLVEGDEGIYFSHIVGAPACIAHPEKACDLSRGVVVNAGSNTLTFHLSSPDPDLLYELALNAAYAVPVSTPLHVHGALPATGPYMFASFTPKRSVRLVRNPRFREWSPAAQPDGFPNQIVMRFGGTPAAHIASVERGAADVASDYAYISPAVLASLRTEHASRLEINPEGSTAAIVFNTRLAPFDNLKARQAVSFALDRQRLLTLTLGQSLGQVTCQILPPNFAGYRRYCPYTVDPAPGGEWVAPDLARARELVRESGTFGEAVTFWIPRWIKFDAAAGRYVVSVLDSLGYKARFRFAADPYAHENALGVQAGFWAWYADFAAPSGFVRNTLTCSSYTPIGALNANSAEFCDHAIDREIGRAQLLQTSNPEAAAQLWAKVDRDLTNQAPWASFANGTVLELISTRVGNYQFNPAWFTLLDQLWLK